MRKIKLLMLGVLSALTLGLFVTTTTNVLAAGEPEEFSAQDLTAGSTINSGTKFYDGTLFDLTMSGTGAYVTTIGGETYDSSKKCSTIIGYTATANDDSGNTYTQAVLPSSTTGSDKVIQITTGSSAINAKVYYTVSDSNFVFTTDKKGNTVAEAYAKSGNINIGGSESSTTGNKARNVAYVENATIPASTTVSIYSSSNRVVLFGIVAEEATVTSYDVTFMDGSSELKVDTVVSGSAINYSPVKYGYDFEGWYTDSSLDSQYKVNTSTYTVTGDVTLYANWTAWTNTGITEYTLTNSAIAKIATGISGSLTDDLELTPSIYTAMTGVAIATTTVTLPGDSDAAQHTCFNTTGAVTTSGYGLKFVAPTNGIVTAYIGSGGNSNRNIKITDGTNELELISGSLAINYDNNGYNPTEIKFAVEEGTEYYVGGDSGVRIYYISYEETPAQIADSVTSTLLKQFDDDNTPTKVRLIGKIEGIAPADYANIENVLMEFDFNGTHKSAYCHKLYKSVATLDNSLVAGDNIMYVVLTISNLDKYDTKSFTNVKMTITFSDDSTKVVTHDNF